MQTTGQPSHGARFQLDLHDAGDAVVRYEAQIFVPGARHAFAVAIALPAGTCTLAEIGREPGEAPDPPPWTTAHVTALTRQLFREAQKGAAWPRRLSRWRGDPKGPG